MAYLFDDTYARLEITFRDFYIYVNGCRLFGYFVDHLDRLLYALPKLSRQAVNLFEMLVKLPWFIGGIA